MSNKTTASKIMADFMSKLEPFKPSPLMHAAINGSLDSYVARDSLKYLPKDQDTISMQDIRNAHNAVFGIGAGSGD